MTSADTIRAALVTKLRAISALVALVGNSTANIVEYVEEDEGGSFGIISRLDPPKLIVMWEGTEGQEVRLNWKHAFSIIVRVSGSPAAVFKQFCEGIPTGSSLPMLNEVIVTGVRPMSMPKFKRRVIPVSEHSSFDYWEIQTSFLE